MTETPKVEFALGNKVSRRHFFKSNFARSFVTNCRDSRSLDYGFLNNRNSEDVRASDDDYHSLVSLETANITVDHVFDKDNPKTDERIVPCIDYRSNRVLASNVVFPVLQSVQSSEDIKEVEKLRKRFLGFATVPTFDRITENQLIRDFSAERESIRMIVEYNFLVKRPTFAEYL
ncbi:hypothetical protein WN51_00104 [Melipona quadrifasciata]|uniref:Uncharacterized protein n=1 Tax=Melipona quadrifasciata TaxID=166423 RepID=A0A0M9ABL0_9HYME|nr:hypothetical protein WN51_00104 [Melipona quadrifasciata]